MTTPEDKKENLYDKCCSEDLSRLEYPSFSVAFIQTFSIYNMMEFTLPCSIMDSRQEKDVNADKQNKAIIPLVHDLEKEIFVLPEEGFKCRPWQRRYRFSPNNLYSFSLRGFDFMMDIIPETDDKFPKIKLSGHAYVDMMLFFAHTVSITYRFCFDGSKAQISDEKDAPCNALTDHIITFLSTYLSAECWSPDIKTDDEKGKGSTTINLQTTLTIKDLWFDKDGSYLKESEMEDLVGDGRAFETIAIRYKKFIYSHCRYKQGIPLSKKIQNIIYRKNHPMTVDNDNHYAMVDIWEDIRHYHPESKEKDLFDEHSGISEKAVIDHIYDFHKPELIGLITLYKNEWIYRDPEAYDEVCGEDIAIDTDDLVLAGSNVSLVIGTYGRRERRQEAETEGEGENVRTNWGEHLREMRQKYHISWQEYMLILQMVLAKKHVMEVAKEQLVRAALSSSDSVYSEVIKDNAEMGMRLSRMIIQLDMLKYSKFPSHKVMFDRTARRLRLEQDAKDLKDIMEMIDSSLHNISDYKNMWSDYIMNIVLAMISVISAIGLIFTEPKIHILDEYSSGLKYIFHLDHSQVGPDILKVVSVLIIVALVYLTGWIIFKLFRLLKSYIRKGK